MQPDVLIVSVVFAVIIYFLTGLSPGGIIVPFYFALYFDYPRALVGTFALALLVYFLLFIAMRLFVFYGRQRFALAVLFGVLLQWGAIHYLPQAMAPLGFIGYVIPGIVANEFHRQGVIITSLMLIISSALLFLLFGGLGLGGFRW